MSNMSKFVAAVLGLVAMAMLISRQLFLFAISPNPQSALGSPARTYHLWLAIGAAMLAAAAGVLMLHFFNRHEKDKWSKVVMTPAGPLITALGGNRFSNLRTLVPFDAKRWALANPWLTEGQADDRLPMDGAVRDIGGSPSGQRAHARRIHQLMFKKWSQARHD